MSEFLAALDQLVRKYRVVPFSEWHKLYSGADCFNDYASDSEDDPAWWQAHSDVLEIVTDRDGRTWANVSITLYPRGVHSSPPAPSAWLAVSDDGQAEGAWTNGDKFAFVQAGDDAA